MKLRLAFYIALIVIAVSAVAQIWLPPRWQPSEEWFKVPRDYGRPIHGFVSKKSTAIFIGRAAILERYDQELLKQLEPLDAKKFGDVWVVYSYLPTSKKDRPVGGVTTVEISSSTGAILNFIRGM